MKIKKICCLSLLILGIMGSVCANAYDSTTYQGRIDEIAALIDECKTKNISVDYEMAAYTTLKEFKTYIENDIADGDKQTRLNYNEEYLEKLYSETKQNLNGYLEGSVTPKKSGYRTTSSKRNVSGKKLIDENGKPVISVGYGHFSEVVNDCDKLMDWGMDNIAVEVGPIWLTRQTDICNFQLNPQSGGTISVSDSGYDGKCLKIVNSSGTESSFSQLVSVEPNTTYTITAYVKCEESLSRFWCGSASDYKNINTEWQKLEWEITTGSNDLFYELKLGSSIKSAGIYVDNVTVKENGSEENKVLNSGFEKGPGYCFHNTYQHIFNALQTAENNNAACNVLIQPAYMPTWWGDVYPDTVNFDSNYHNNIGVIINDETVLEFYKEFYAFTAHMLKGYDSLSTIILANEPRYETLGAKDFYNSKFAEWTANLYENDISKLNSAYGTDYTDFSQVTMPENFYETNKTYTPLDYDWLCFNQDMVKEFFEVISNSVRSETDIPLSIKIENPLVVQSPEIGLSKNLRYGINIEKLSNTFDIAGCDNYCVYNWKETRSDTMAWYDMLTSLTGKPVYNSEDHVIPDDGGYFGTEQAQYVRFNLWQGAFHGKVMSSLWTYGIKDYDTISERADCVYEASKTAWDLRANADTIYKVIDKKPNVAIMYSQSSRIYSTSAYSSSLYNAYRSAVSSGGKVGFVTDEDISKLVDYKVLVLPNVTYLKSEALKGIQTFIQNGGKVIKIGDCFVGDEHKQSLDNEALNYVNTNSVNSENLVSEIHEALSEKLSITDEAGNLINGIDVSYVVSKGKAYVNLCNVTNNNINCNINYDGEKVESALDLFNNTTLTSFSLEPTVPMLISFDTNGEIVNFEVISFENGNVKIKSNSTNNVTATVAVLLRGKNGQLKGVAADTKRYKPNEIKEFSVGFSEMTKEDTLSVEVWDSFENRNMIETIYPN